jgi:hypothetical protein
MNYDSPAKQFAPVPAAPVRPVGNVFSPQTQQVANQMYGKEIPGSYDRALPQGMYATAQEAITAKTNSRMAQALGGAYYHLLAKKVVNIKNKNSWNTILKKSKKILNYQVR